MTSLSIGACLFGAEEMLRWEHFYARADQAMYMAKQRGGGCVAWLE
jgi:GGDEF domain-containing protein